MTDFERSFRQGLDAAKMAQKSRLEIREVFAELNKQLHSASDGKARMEVVELEEVLSDSDSMLNTLSALAISLRPKEPKRYKAIAIRHSTAKDFRLREVARWKQGPYGYPCWINVDAQEIACSDRQSLEAELAMLASSPKVGEAVLAAMSHVPKSIPAPPAPLNDQT